MFLMKLCSFVFLYANPQRIVHCSRRTITCCSRQSVLRSFYSLYVQENARNVEHELRPTATRNDVWVMANLSHRLISPTREQ
jgi:hypothetical protein